MSHHVKIFLVPVFLVGLLSSLARGDSGIHGRIFGQSENAGQSPQTVANAEIELLGPTGQVVAQTTSSASGYFQANVPQGTYRYRVRAQGFQSQKGERGVTVRNPEHLAVYNITLARGTTDDEGDEPPPGDPTTDPATVYGNVFYTTDTGQRVGIAGASVSFGGPENLLTLWTVDTANNVPELSRGAGNYTLDVWPGRYTASASAEGFEKREPYKTIEVEAGQPTVVDFELFPAAPPSHAQGIHARVTLDEPFATGADELNVAAVSISDPSRPIAFATTDGRLWSVDLPEDRYRVVAFAEGFDRVVSGPVEVFAGRYSRIDLSLRHSIAERVPPETPGRVPPDRIGGQGIVGTVKFDPPPTDGSVAAVQMSQVEVRIGSADSRTTTQVTPDASGKFKVDLSTGPYRVVASAADWKADGQGVTVTPGQYAPLELTLRRAATAMDPKLVTMVDITVREADGPRGAGKPIPGAMVIARDNVTSIAGAPRSTTDASGSAKMRLAVGTMYVLVAQKSGYVSQGKRFVARESGANRLEFQLVRSSVDAMPVVPLPPIPESPGRSVNLVVQVYGTGGPLNRARPLRGAHVVISRSDVPVTSVRTDSDGRAGLDLPPGSYQIDTRLAGFQADQAMIQLTEQTTTIRVFLREELSTNPTSPTPPVRPDSPPPPEMSLTQVNIQVGGVTPQRGNQIQRLGGARVTLRLNGQVVGSGITNSSGLTNYKLSPNQYQLAVERTGYTSKSESLLVGRQTVNHRVLLSSVTQTPPPTTPPPTTPPPPTQPQPKVVALNVQVGGVSPASGNRVTLLSGASVVIRNRGRTVASGATNAAGVFAAQIEPGTLEINVTYPSYTSQSVRFVLGASAASHRILLRAAQPTQPPAPPPTTPSPPPTVRNTTLTIQVGGKDPGGSNRVSLLSAATVTITSEGQARASGATNAGGLYTAQLPPGRYDIRVTHSGHYDGKSAINLQQSTPLTERVLLQPKRKIE